ncbi:hypothetical protein GX865_01590 [Candidatus Saccharibacteria bacterium]|jgi:DNA-binding MarR family transcriptional regulator|nr:hypothetical protein [Candidatus Saccharibacteria bacterium]
MNVRIASIGKALEKLEKAGINARHFELLAREDYGESVAKKVVDLLDREHSAIKKHEQLLRDKKNSLLSSGVNKLQLDEEILEKIQKIGVKTVRNLTNHDEGSLRDIGLGEDEILQILKSLDQFGGEDFCFELNF